MKQVILIFIFSLQSFAYGNVEALAGKVIKLRKEVELLNDEYKTEREKALNDLKALSIQKAELESNIRSEDVREKQLSEKISNYKKELKQTSLESKELTPVLVRTMTSLKEYISQSLPFKQKERLEAVETLGNRLEKGEVTPIKASNQLWSIIEDEKRLSKETSVHKQTIPINGKMNLAEVVKVGMLFLYFKSDDGKIGMAQQKQGVWSFETFSEESQQKQTLAFLQSIKKQIRQGEFQLPAGI